MNWYSLIKISNKSNFKFIDQMSGVVDYFVTQNDRYIVLNNISIQQQNRNQGIGTRFMKQLSQYANSVNKPIYLTPTGQFGSNKKKLMNWYKQYGFKNKPKSDSAGPWNTMSRPPVKTAQWHAQFKHFSNGTNTVIGQLMPNRKTIKQPNGQIFDITGYKQIPIQKFQVGQKVNISSMYPTQPIAVVSALNSQGYTVNSSSGRKLNIPSYAALKTASINTKIASGDDKQHSYGCLMLKVDMPDWDKVLEMVDKEDVNEQAGGLQKNPHITILYGLHDDQIDQKQLQMKIKQAVQSPIEVTLTKINFFQNKQQKFDVVKYQVKSQKLNQLNESFSKFKNSNKYKTYSPHLTIAYVKLGYGSKYCKEMKNIQLNGNQVEYSKSNGERLYFKNKKTQGKRLV